ncbi:MULTISPECIES: esterase YqiA [Vibrio]|uniref:Esterase YqiA n=1 Tax=Vibrio algicola TaxID=2662262 RepID=A0A5Q0TGE6_9VIBR|nr:MULTISPECIES: esterase YqiA [Vibrio]MBD1576861.1 esterase YqiA [Vibrio sp. S11_S32]
MLLYLHGFNSSPLSLKANIMQSYCQQHRPDIKLVIPQLPNFPAQAAEYLSNLVQQYSSEYQIGLVGSSLGGYLSTWLNHHYGFRAVVVNPAVRPYELLSGFLGPQVNPYTQQNYVLEAKHIQELKALEIEVLSSAQDFWVLLQTQDEVLDYQQAVTKYVSSKVTVEEGGDHSFVDFERYPEQIIKFLQL